MIDFKVKASDTRVRVMFDQLPKRLRANLKRTITELTDELLVRVRAAEPRRTGLLQRETVRFVDEREDFIRGRVRILARLTLARKLAKVRGAARRGGGHDIAAAALEYGAHRRFPVSAYVRNGHRVSAYSRTANITEQRFLRNPADAMRAKVLAELQRAIDQTVTEMNRNT